MMVEIIRKIETAKLVIADVTGANPNVYLEIGYAWGTNKKTLLIAHKNEKLKFDIQSQRCLLYRNITHLSKLLETDLPHLL